MEKIIIIVITIFTVLSLLGIYNILSDNKKIDKINTNGETFTFNANPNEFFMTARQVKENITIEENETSYYRNFKNLKDGDTLIIKDEISTIHKSSFLNNAIIVFYWNKGFHYDHYDLKFNNNITSLFEENDVVEIEIKIKHVNFSFKSKKYDIEVFESEWNKSFFISKISNGSSFDEGVLPLPKTCIKHSSFKIDVINEENFFDWKSSDLLKVYDKNVSTFMIAQKNINDLNWSDWVVLENLNKKNLSKVRFLASNHNDNPIFHCQIKISNFENNFSTIIYDTVNGSHQWSDASDYSYDDWCEVSFTPTVVDKAMIRFKAIKGNTVKPKLYEFELI